MSKIVPEHFTRAEFVRGGVDWFPLMSDILLERLGGFRHVLNADLLVSHIAGALGRHLGAANTSQHNIDRWKEVRAVDVMVPGMKSGADRKRVFELAKASGFTGIGVSPIWHPHQGLHLDVRADRLPGDPAIWSYARSAKGAQVMVGLVSAFV